MKRRAFLSLLGLGAAAPVAARLVSEPAEAAPVAANGPVKGELCYFHVPVSDQTRYHGGHSHAYLAGTGTAECRIFDGDKWVKFDSVEGHAVWNSIVRGMA